MRKLVLLLVLVLLAAVGAEAESASAAVILGTTGVRPQVDQNGSGSVEAFRTAAVASGTLSSVSVYVNATSASTKLFVGVYTDNNGHPGTLLTQGSKTAPAAGATNDVTVPSASITSGTQYWIAIMGTGGQLTFRDQANGGKSETYAITGQTAMPATWQTGTTYTDGNLSAYGSSGTVAAPVLNVTPTSLSFAATTSGSDPPTKTAALTNTGGGTLSFTTSAGAAWLGVSPASGSAPATLTVAPHVTGLSAGTYDANVTVTAPGATGSPQTIAVHLVVTDPPPPAPVLAVSPTSLSFTATTGGADPATKTASVTNTGTGTLSFTTSTSGGAAWLAATPASGSAPATVTVAPHVSGLSAGTYDANVSITASGVSGSPKTVAVHLVVADAAPADAHDWLQVDHDPERTGFASGETAIGPAQARTLGAAWSTTLDGKLVAQPLYAGNVTVGGTTRNVVIQATSADSVYAIDAATGTVLWRRNFSTPGSNCAIPGGYGMVAPPAIDKARGRIYAVTENGALRTLALADGTDAAPAVPIITGPATNRVWGGPTLIGSSTLYVPTASDGCDSAPWRGRILKVDVSGATPSLTKQWDVVQGIPAPNGGGGIWGYGGVSVDRATGNVFTATGADSVEAYNTYADRLVALDSGLNLLGSIEPFHPTSYPCAGDPCDVDFGATPAVFTPTGCPTMVAAGNKNGVLYVTRTTTLAASGTAEQALQLNPANDWLGSGGVGGVPAWSPDQQMLYVTDVGDGEPGIAAGVVALKAGADCRLSVAWSATLGGGLNPNSTPTVANGVVYVSEGYTGKLAAYDAQTGERLFLSTTTGAGGFAAPMVANGTVFQGDWDGYSTAAKGTLRAYQPGATPPPPPPTPVLGTTSVGTQSDQNTNGNAEAFQATATGTGSITSMALYLDSGSSAAKVTIGIYADNGASHPGTLLSQGSKTTLTAGAWNTIAIPSAAIANGTRYWIAILGTNGGTVRFRDRPGGCNSESSASSALTALPATWTTGAKYTDCPLSAYGDAGL